MSLCEIDIPAWSFVAALGTFSCMLLWSHWRAVRMGPSHPSCRRCGGTTVRTCVSCRYPAHLPAVPSLTEREIQALCSSALDMLKEVAPRMFQSLKAKNELAKYASDQARLAIAYVKKREPELARLLGDSVMARESALAEARKYILKPFPTRS